MSEEKDIKELLGIDNSSEDKESSQQFTQFKIDKILSSKGDNAAETILTWVAYGILVIGILASIITGISVGSGYYASGFQGFLVFLAGTVGSIITWAMCMVVVNISVNIRQTKKEIKALRKDLRKK